MSDFRIGDRVRYQGMPGEGLTPRWVARTNHDSIVVDLPGPGRPAYGMAAVGRVDRWFAVPGRLVRA